MVLLVGATVVSSMISTVLSQQQRLLAEKVQLLSTQRLAAVTSTLPLIEYERPAFLDRLQRVMRAAISRPYGVATGVTGLVGGLFGAIAIAITLLGLVPALVPLLLLGGIPSVVIGRWASRSEFRFAVRTSTLSRLRTYLQLLLMQRDAAKEIRAFGSGPMLIDRWQGAGRDYLRELGRQVRLRSILSMASTTMTGLVALAAILLLAKMLSSGSVSLAEAGAALAAVRLLGSRVQAVSASSASLFESALFLDDLDRFVRIADESPATGRPRPEPFRTLVAEALTFRYPETRQETLRGINLELRSGEVVALVGENGSGKTTLAKVLAGLYEPTSGSLRWDGRDIGDLDPVGARESVAVVFQDFTKYALTARENVSIGRPGRSGDHDGVLDAIDRAGLREAIERLPDGFDTLLGAQYSGHDLSGGQWQRIALARAFFRDAPFVILDEPTASMDPRAEHALFSDIRTLLAGRTVLLISHRFSSVRDADRIYVMDAGRLVEQGTHDELMTLGGQYAEMFTLQASAYSGATSGERG
jgi:ATP-binding cassette subfamily B protein